MPNNSTFASTVNSTGIYDNPQNKIPLGAGIITIEKITGNYARVIFNHCISSMSYGSLYLASINANTKIVNGWYEIAGVLIQ